MLNGESTLPQLESSMRFIDLFAGLGGFHVALAGAGHRCVFASELDPELRDLYEKNFLVKPSGDIRKVNVADIPAMTSYVQDRRVSHFRRQGRSRAENAQNGEIS